MELGFTRHEWQIFSSTGILTRENVLHEREIELLLQCIDEQPVYAQWNVVEKDRCFEFLIDHPQHFWLIYDLYGEASKLTRSEYFRREPGTIQLNRWHFDGPRNLTFQAFRAALPFRVKVAYWLTDLTAENMGNFIYLPGSHRDDVFDGYQTHDPWPGEVQVLATAGSMTMMWGGLWHRVAENDSDITRKNVFLEYGPSWIVSGDRTSSDPEWLTSLTRRRRILMRDYSSSPNDFIKIPKSDIPLVPCEEAVARGGTPPRSYNHDVPHHLKKFPTRVEEWICESES